MFFVYISYRGGIINIRVVIVFIIQQSDSESICRLYFYRIVLDYFLAKSIVFIRYEVNAKDLSEQT